MICRAVAARHVLLACIALAALGACASGGAKSGAGPSSGEGGVSRAVSQTQAGFSDAALSPLNDLNVRREEIPPRLARLVSPYEPLAARTCVAIGVEVLELTNIIGPDSDAPPPGEESLGQQAGDGASRLALNQVSSTMSDFIPFRSLVRQATGASAHERRLRAAYERGVQRRAYLKGIGASMGCAPPAAPDPKAGLPAPLPDIEYRSDVTPTKVAPATVPVERSPVPAGTPVANASPPTSLQPAPR